MTKKFISAIVTTVAAMTLFTATVFALPSVGETQEVTTSKDTVKSDAVVTVDGQQTTINDAIASNSIKLVFSSATTEELQAAGVDATAIKEITDLLNSSSADDMNKKLDAILGKSSTESGDKIDKDTLSLLTKLQELSFKTDSGDVVEGAKNVTVTWKAPITSDMNVDNVRVLHYSTVSGWELIKPSAVDPATGSITAFFKDLSPVAIVYVDAENANGGSGSSGSSSDNNVATGDSSNVVIYVTLLAVAAIAGVACVAKKKANN
ncbi:MAG: hypothetical protein ACI4E1_02640 [Lachnospira sp.]